MKEEDKTGLSVLDLKISYKKKVKGKNMRTLFGSPESYIL